jgi:hypothetical protein
MKKFKNIRLMLVGLLCLMGVNAFAAVGDLQTDGTYWFQVSNEAKSEVYFAGLSIAASPTTKITIPATARLKNNLNSEVTYTVVGVCKAGDASDGKWWMGTAEYTQDLSATAITELTFDLVIDGVGTGNRNDWDMVVKPAIEKFYATLETLKVSDARNITELPVLSQAKGFIITSLDLGGVKNGGNAITLPDEFVKKQSFKKLVLPTEPLIAGGAAFAYVQGLKADGTPQALDINTAKFEEFGKWAFLDANVKTITIGPKVANIGDEAFKADADEYALIQAVVWQSDKILPGVAPNLPYVPAAFAGQKKIASITVSGANIYSIEAGAFVDVTGPVKVDLSAAPDLKSIEGAFAPTTTFNEVYLKGTNLPAANGKLKDIIDLAASETTLEKLSLPASVNTLEPFTSYTKLNTIDMSVSGITAIPASGFENCIALATITLPAATTSIGNKAFKNTILTGIVIPGECTSIGEEAFAEINDGAYTYAADNKTGWHVGFALDLTGATKLATVGKAAFRNTNVTGTVDFTSTAVIAIPDDAFYIEDTSWELGENGKFMSGTTGPKWDEKYALTEVKINAGKDKDNTASIGKNAFKNNIYLAKADLNKAFLNTIDQGAFQNTALTEVNLKDTKVTKIYSYSFADNEALKTVTLNEGTTQIGKSAFAGDIALATVNNLGKEKLKVIREYAFYESAIPELDFSEATSLTTIGSYAFGQYYDVANDVWKPTLTKITFPAETCTDPESEEEDFDKKYSNKVQVIDEAAFYGASLVTEINNLEACKLTTLNQLFTANLPGDVDLKANDSSFDDQTPLCPAGLKNLTLPSISYDAKGEKFTTVSWDAKGMMTPIALETIAPYALQGLGIENIAIPATVTSFGGCVLQGNLKLKKVEWYDAQQKKIHKYTFRGDTNLEEFYYMTAQGPVKSKGITDNHFYWCSKEKLTVYVTSESLLQLLADGYTTANAKYSKLNDELSDEITFTAKNAGDNMYYRSYFNPYYATWIAANENVKVYIAAVKGSKVEMTEADTENGYYKIKQYDPIKNNDGEAVCIIASATETLPVELYGLPANNITTLQSKVNELECVDSEETASKLNFRFKFGKNSKTGQLGFFRVTSGVFKVGSVILKAKDPARMLDFYPVAGDETGINTIEENVDDNAPVYNLQGVRVDNLQKGQLYIKNGKKFMK